MKTYADQCIERAEKAEEWGLLLKEEHSGSTLPQAFIFQFGLGNPVYPQHHHFTFNQIKFFFSAKRDITELTRRLNVACEFIKSLERQTSVSNGVIFVNSAADELEKPL